MNLISKILMGSALALFPNLTLQAEESSESPEKQEVTSPERQAALRVQLFLDKKGFGPGRIDARWGGFTRKAAERWNAAKGDPKIDFNEAGELQLSESIQKLWSGDLKTKYTLTEEDQKSVGELPEEAEDQAKQKNLPYQNLLELVAEKFHAYPEFIRELNELEAGNDLKVGQEIWVPNVARPFSITKIQDLEDHTEKGEGAAHQITILREKEIVEVRKDDKLVHSFPITVGASGNVTPAGSWEVEIVKWLPEFRYDKEMLNNGTRSSDSHMLPPGPNNPVGIVWIGISSDGIGLHGTAHPDTIGRSESHGCIRLSNWDAEQLGKLVVVGSPVEIK